MPRTLDKIVKEIYRLQDNFICNMFAFVNSCQQILNEGQVLPEDLTKVILKFKEIVRTGGILFQGYNEKTLTIEDLLKLKDDDKYIAYLTSVSEAMIPGYKFNIDYQKNKAFFAKLSVKFNQELAELLPLNNVQPMDSFFLQPMQQIPRLLMLINEIINTIESQNLNDHQTEELADLGEYKTEELTNLSTYEIEEFINLSPKEIKALKELKEKFHDMNIEINTKIKEIMNNIEIELKKAADNINTEQKELPKRKSFIESIATHISPRTSLFFKSKTTSSESSEENSPKATEIESKVDAIHVESPTSKSSYSRSSSQK